MSSDINPRAGIFNTPIPEQCQHYARFLANITRRQADGIFWSMFVTVIILLVISSSMYTRASLTLSDPELALESKSRRLSTTHRRTRVYCLCVSVLCFFMAVPCIVLEAFAAFHIQFCGGEDLMMLYWNFWSLLQVGSMIAILGVVLNQWYGLKGHSQPPWAVALGTPVLIVAALAHAGQSVVNEWRDVRRERNGLEPRRSSRSRNRSRSGSATPVQQLGVPMSRATTIVSTVPAGARFVGWTLENEPLFAFPSDTEVGMPSKAHSRRQSSIDPKVLPSTTTPPQSQSPEREVKFVEEV